MKQNQVYAMPSKLVYISCDTPLTTAQASNDASFSNFVNLTQIDGKFFNCAGAFFRITSGDVQVTVRKPQ